MDLGLKGRTVVLSGPPGAVSEACRARFEAENAVIAADPASADVVVVIAPAAGDLDLEGGDDVLDAAWDPVVGAVGQYKAALDPERSRSWGRLVYVVPAGELPGIGGMGVLGLHKCVGWEWGPHAVTANAVLAGPDAVDDDVAAAVAFLASDRAGYLSGVSVRVG